MANADDAVVLTDHAGALASYPHARRVGNLLFVCGTSSRRADNSHDGVELADDGTVALDIVEQTRAVIRNIEKIVVAAGGSLGDVVDLTTFLVNMDDFAGYNRAYDEFFEQATGPTRTTLAVRALPHPNLLIEIKAIAVIPG